MKTCWHNEILVLLALGFLCNGCSLHVKDVVYTKSYEMQWSGTLLKQTFIEPKQGGLPIADLRVLKIKSASKKLTAHQKRAISVYDPIIVTKNGEIFSPITSFSSRKKVNLVGYLDYGTVVCDNGRNLTAQVIVVK